MNILQVWIVMKILVILLFFSGLFGMIRFFMHPDMSVILMMISLSGVVGGIFLYSIIYRTESKLSDQAKELGINFWDPWQDVDD